MRRRRQRRSSDARSSCRQRNSYSSIPSKNFLFTPGSSFKHASRMTIALLMRSLSRLAPIPGPRGTCPREKDYSELYAPRSVARLIRALFRHTNGIRHWRCNSRLSVRIMGGRSVNNAQECIYTNSDSFRTFSLSIRRGSENGRDIPGIRVSACTH
jgi:hypothetical protein